jgi:hypothetical protein
MIGGCAVCGGVPLLAGGALVGMGLLLVAASLQAGGCGAVVGVILGVVFAVAGVLPLSFVGLTGTAGTVAGGTLVRLLRGGSLLPALLGPLVGLLPALIAIGALGLLLGVLGWQADQNEPWLLPALGVGAAAAVALSLLAGPVAIAGGVGAIALWPAVSGPPEGAAEERTARRTSTTPSGVAMAY